MVQELLFCRPSSAILALGDQSGRRWMTQPPGQQDPQGPAWKVEMRSLADAKLFFECRYATCHHPEYKSSQHADPYFVLYLKSAKCTYFDSISPSMLLAKPRSQSLSLSNHVSARGVRPHLLKLSQKVIFIVYLSDTLFDFLRLTNTSLESLFGSLFPSRTKAAACVPDT